MTKYLELRFKFFFGVIFTLMIIIIVLVIADKNDNTTNKELACYRTLYNEDIIGNGCDVYFEQDSWYQEYIELEKVEK